MFSAIRLAKINLYKHLGTVNFWTPFILAAAAVVEITIPFREITKYYSTPVNGFSAAFIWVELHTVFIIFLGVFILFSDLPFKDNQQMFLISRSGKRVWIFSHILYVIFVSFMYMAFIFVFYCIRLIPYIGFGPSNWGKILRSLSSADIARKFEMKFVITSVALTEYTPPEGVLYSFGTAFAVTVIIGLIVLLFNLTVKRNFGVILSGMIVFYYMFCDNHHDGYIAYYFSPLHWISLLKADRSCTTGYPDVPWIIAVLCIVFAAEIIALFIYGSKKIRFVMDTKEELK